MGSRIGFLKNNKWYLIQISNHKKILEKKWKILLTQDTLSDILVFAADAEHDTQSDAESSKYKP